jgi:hypothetical protein
VIEDAHHVQEDEEDHEVRAPPVDVARDLAERNDRLDPEDVGVRLRCRRGVEEHQVDARHRKDEEEEEAQAAEAEGVGELHRVLANPHWVEVEEDVVHHRIGAASLVVRVGVAEDGAPGCRPANRLIDPRQ